jgi:acetylornithine/N-succinyldiaminopimelate aminotransferase
MIESLIPFYEPTEKIIERALDCNQFDSDNKAYIDFEAGVWCANVGHNHKRLIRIIETQIKEIIHHGYRFRNRYSEELAEKLNNKLGFEGGQSVFLSSGSEAINLAITISRHLTKREKILKINNSFLSAYGFGHLSPDNPYKVDILFNDSDAISNINFNDISAFILESGGASVDVVQFPSKEFVSKIVKIAKEQGVIIIVDEVTTGFGRTGEWFGFFHYDIEPDIVVTAKGLGNGFPISGVTINSKLVKYLKQNPFNYLQSHINDPLGCAIGLEIIRIIEDEKLVEKSRETGDYFKGRLNSLKEKYPGQVMEIRARGLILALEFSKHVDGNLINNKLFDMGFLIGFKKNVLRFLPPLTIKLIDIDKFIKALDELLALTTSA